MKSKYQREQKMTSMEQLTYPVADLAVKQFNHKRIKVAIIFSNGDSNMKIWVCSWSKCKVISRIHNINAMWKVPLSTNVLLKCCSCCPSTVNLIVKPKLHCCNNMNTYNSWENISRKNSGNMLQNPFATSRS